MPRAKNTTRSGHSFSTVSLLPTQDGSRGNSIMIQGSAGVVSNHPHYNAKPSDMKIIINRKVLRLIFIFSLTIAEKYNYGQQILAKYKTDSNADSFDIKSASYLLPQAHPKWHYYHSFSFSYVDIPAAWALQKVNAPLITYQAKFSLPYGLDLQGSLATVYVSNRLNVGPSWNYSIHHYHIGIGYQIAYDFGELNQFGFKTKFSGWEQQPFISAGYSFKKIAVILKWDLYLANSIDFDEGGHSVPMWDSFTNGYSISAGIEQRLYRNKLISVGIKLNNIRYHFLAWPAFPVNQNNYWVPEFQLGIKL